MSAYIRSILPIWGRSVRNDMRSGGYGLNPIYKMMWLYGEYDRYPESAPANEREEYSADIEKVNIAYQIMIVAWPVYSETLKHRYINDVSDAKQAKARGVTRQTISRWHKQAIEQMEKLI